MLFLPCPCLVLTLFLHWSCTVLTVSCTVLTVSYPLLTLFLLCPYTVLTLLLLYYCTIFALHSCSSDDCLTLFFQAKLEEVLLPLQVKIIKLHQQNVNTKLHIVNLYVVYVSRL
jgi:hypothetical protein